MLCIYDTCQSNIQRFFICSNKVELEQTNSYLFVSFILKDFLVRIKKILIESREDSFLALSPSKFLIVASSIVEDFKADNLSAVCFRSNRFLLIDLYNSGRIQLTETH